jgi:hypothetical protein
MSKLEDIKPPIFRVVPIKDTEEDKKKAEMMDALMQYMIPRSRQEEIVREAMMHVMNCGDSKYGHCLCEIRWEEILAIPKDQIEKGSQ